MTTLDSDIKEFKPGTLGWTAADLDDPRFEPHWFAGRYEIVEGVLTEMAPPSLYGQWPLSKVMQRVATYFDACGMAGAAVPEVDLVITPRRVVRADAIWMSVEQRNRQERLARDRGYAAQTARVLVPPLLVVEAMSRGHESHDRETKRAWYAEFGVQHYWLLDPLGRTIECLALRQGVYESEQCAGEKDVLAPPSFDGMNIPLADIW